jgi:hypothetical protein
VVELPEDEPLDFDPLLAALAIAAPPPTATPRIDTVARATRSRFRIGVSPPSRGHGVLVPSEQAVPKTSLMAG